MTHTATVPNAGTLLLDFDSTLIRVESLEEILKPFLEAQPAMVEAFRAITTAGMEGRMDFQQSLQRRLQIARPTLSQVRAFGEAARAMQTPGMSAMIATLRGRGVDVRIVSGGLVEAILPTALSLGIPEDHVHAVRLNWDPTGNFLGTQSTDLFHISKVAGLLPLVPTWVRPIIAVGDGITDYRICKEGLADAFVAFTLHAQRESVIATGAPFAGTVTELTRILEELI